MLSLETKYLLKIKVAPGSVALIQTRKKQSGNIIITYAIHAEKTNIFSIGN